MNARLQGLRTPRLVPGTLALRQTVLVATTPSRRVFAHPHKELVHEEQ